MVLKIEHFLVPAGLLLLAGCVAPADDPRPAPAPRSATANPSVGGAVMDPAASIAQKLASSNEHSALNSALRAAELNERLSGAGQFTLFAPTDAAFARLPRGTMESLLAPANKLLLGEVLSYHVIPGRKTQAAIAGDIAAGGGFATYRTLQGGSIRVSMQGGAMSVTDGHGNRNLVRIADALASNGVFHVIEGVLLPGS